LRKRPGFSSNCKAHPDEKGTERFMPLFMPSLVGFIARPIPMKRELKENEERIALCHIIAIARPIPMKRELKGCCRLL